MTTDATIAPQGRQVALYSLRACLSAWQILLYVNNVSPAAVVQLTDLVEATFPGYARQSPLFSTTAFNPDGSSSTFAPPLTWVRSPGAGTQTVYGWAAVDSISGALVCLAPFATPVVLALPGDQVQISQLEVDLCACCAPGKGIQWTALAAGGSPMDQNTPLSLKILGNHLVIAAITLSVVPSNPQCNLNGVPMHKAVDLPLPGAGWLGVFWAATVGVPDPVVIQTTFGQGVNVGEWFFVGVTGLKDNAADRVQAQTGTGPPMTVTLASATTAANELAVAACFFQVPAPSFGIWQGPFIDIGEGIDSPDTSGKFWGLRGACLVLSAPGTPTALYTSQNQTPAQWGAAMVTFS